MLTDHGIAISMDGRGRCHDNIFVEALRCIGTETRTSPAKLLCRNLQSPLNVRHPARLIPSPGRREKAGRDVF